MHSHILLTNVLSRGEGNALALFGNQIRLEGTLLNLLFGSLLSSHLSFVELMLLPSLISVHHVLALRWGQRFFLHLAIILFG